MIVVYRLLVSHHLKTFQETIMKTALHAAVAHRGTRDMSHFEIIFSNLQREVVVVLSRGGRREKVQDPWPPVM
jgi:hypothetical protein